MTGIRDGESRRCCLTARPISTSPTVSRRRCSMVRTDRLVGLFIVGVCVTGCADSPDASDGVVRPVTAVRGTLRQVAHGIAKRAGVEAPASMIAVAAPDHQAAEAVVSGALIADH